MIRFLQQHFISICLYLIITIGLGIVCRFLEVNTIRGDEFLSYLHSNPQWTFKEIISHIHGGADNSYTHAVLLWVSFTAFGYTIFVQRMFSAVCWLLGLWLLRKMVLKETSNKETANLSFVLVGFSNMGIYLATDGRFYSLLFCLAVASVYVLYNRQSYTTFLFLLLFGGLQLVGLLTSANFMVFQLLLVSGLLLHKIVFTTALEWKHFYQVSASILVSAVVYFTWLKIPYYHTYFLQGFFSSGQFDIEKVKTFVSIPFRWMMLPHFPFCSDEMDAGIFMLILIGSIIYLRKKLVSSFREMKESSMLVFILFVLLIVGFGLQLLVYGVMGYPLWESRYYAGVFFVFPLLCALLLKPLLSPKIIAAYCCLILFRLVAVEYPKMISRTQEVASVTQYKTELQSQSKPILFSEDFTDKNPVFVLMGNLYIRYPEVRTKMFFYSDPTQTERTKYFKRLSDWHYPVGLVFEKDTEQFYLVEYNHLR